MAARLAVAVGVFLIIAGLCSAGERGLVGYWKFDDGRGDLARDSSGNDYHGEIWGGEWVRGKFGTALRLNGEDSYVVIPQLGGIDGSNELTVEVWVYWEDTGRYPNIITGGRWAPGGFLLFVRDRNCMFRLGKPTKEGDQWGEVGAVLLRGFSLKRWYHLAAVFKRPTLTTYVDGKRVSTAKWDFPVGYSGDLIIGKWGKVCHRGLIDEVRIYNRALSEEEIRSEYEREVAGRASAGYEVVANTNQPVAPDITIENDFVKLGLSSLGRCVALSDKRTGKNYLAKATWLMTLEKGGRVYNPSSCSFEDGRLIFRFKRAGVEAVLAAKNKGNYFAFKVDSVRGNGVERLNFVRLCASPAQYASRMSGMTADDEYAVCMRALNLNANIVLRGSPPLLTAYCEAEYGLVGAGAAVVACRKGQLRAVLKRIVENEGLPKSPLGGPWAVEAEENRGSYIFADPSARDAELWIDLVRRAGAAYLHFSGWYEKRGSYEPRKNLFPRGLEDVKAVVDKAHAAGLKVGMHTLTGCISVGTKWVAPVPDERLATDEKFTLSRAISQNDTTIPVNESPAGLDTVWGYASRGNVIRIDDELIQYGGLSDSKPYAFLRCKRGVFGTKPAPHADGADVFHMLIRYFSFIPDEKSSLVGEVADSIARVFNGCGFDMIYMDGSEAMRGWYGIARMREAIFRRLKRPALVEASSWGHHSWVFHSRIGAWDHPRWGLKQFIDTHCRALQQHINGSLLPGHLGWWAILGHSNNWDAERLDEIEYLCCKALGYDLSLSFQGVSARNPSNVRQNEYFTVIGWYERLRLSGYFSDTVRAKLREEGNEFKLRRDESGEWQLIPTDYMEHKVTSLDNGSNRWTVRNRFGEQPARLRIQALYGVCPYDSRDALVIADFADEKEFATHRDAPKVKHKLEPSTERVKAGKTSGRFTATNSGDSRVGAWAHARKIFDPPIDLRKYGALGVWVFGDGKGEIINLQLSSPRQFYHALYDEHYIKVDFTGWRYFELPFRERDADSYGDYVWPYRGISAIYRTPLVRRYVNELNIYLNNLPPNDSVECYISPIRALRTVSVNLDNPAVSIGGRKILFPVTLRSDWSIEFDSLDDCRVYDERGALVRRIKPRGEVPVLAGGKNDVVFTCEGTEGYNARAMVTVIACGEPLTERAPTEKIDWRCFDTEYELPRTILALDGRQNRWDVICPERVSSAGVELEILVNRVGGTESAYYGSDAITIEDFSDIGAFEQSEENQYARFVYNSEHRGIAAKPGVTQRLEMAKERAKVGDSCALYTATSTRQDNRGWSSKGRRFSPPLDLSRYRAIGFYLYGDGKGESFKVQLRDVSGAAFDMVTRIDFAGWRYRQFDIADAPIDLSKIEYIIIYFNGIPAGETVRCYVDDIRAFPVVRTICNPRISVGDRTVVFPVSMSAGERLIFKGMRNCMLYGREGDLIAEVEPSGEEPRLHSGINPVRFSLSPDSAKDFSVTVSITKICGKARR